MESNFKKTIKYMIIFAILAVLSIWGVFAFNKDCSFTDLMASLRKSNPVWITAAVLSMMGFILFEGLALTSLTRGLGLRSPIHHGAVYSAADIYFSAITPSASGGQPASAYFMIKNGIPATQATVILLVNLVMYSLSLLLFGSAALAFQFRGFLLLDTLSKILILTGSILMALLCMGFLLLLTKKQIIYSILSFFIKIGYTLKFVKHPERLMGKLDHLIEQYGECSQSIAGKKAMLLKAFAFNMLQRLSHTLVSVCCFLALGGRQQQALTVGEVQMFCSLGANSIPIPGGMGVTDYLMLKGFGNIVDDSIAANLALLSRGLAFYGSIVVSIIILLTGCLISWKKRKC